MTNEEKFNYWLNQAQYDMDTAESMLNTGRYLYVVFTCQQAIEKLVKGLYLLYIDDNIPRIHDINAILLRFSGKLAGKIPDDTLEFFARLGAFYLNTRYPQYKDKMNEQVNADLARVCLNKTKELFQWLKTLKP